MSEQRPGTAASANEGEPTQEAAWCGWRSGRIPLGTPNMKRASLLKKQRSSLRFSAGITG